MTTLQEQQLLIYSRLDEVQREAVDLALQHKRLAIGDDVGTGKTVMSCVTMFLAQPKRVLVICQTGPLADSWRTHIRDWAPNYKTYLTDVDGRTADVYYKPNEEHYVVVTTPGRIKSDQEFISKGKFDMIIVDEAHFLASRTSKQSRAVEKLCYTTFRDAMVLLLSATFIKNSVADVYIPLKIINASTKEGREEHTSFHAWADNYIDKYTKQSGPFQTTVYNGFKDDFTTEEYLNRCFRPFFLFRRVATNYTPMSFHIEQVEMLPEQAYYYQQARDSLMIQIGEKYMDVLHVMTQIQLFRQIAISHHLMDESQLFLDGAKVERTIELIQQTESDEKVIVFTSFARAAKKLAYNLFKEGIPTITVTGEIKGSNRVDMIEMFKNDPEYKVLVITGGTGGAGLNLQIANVAILLDLPWTGANMKQQIGRVNRRGQSKSVKVFIVECKGTIDEKLRTTCYNKLESLDDLISLKNDLTRRIKNNGSRTLLDLL